MEEKPAQLAETSSLEEDSSRITNNEGRQLMQVFHTLNDKQRKTHSEVPEAMKTEMQMGQTDFENRTSQMGHEDINPSIEPLDFSIEKEEDSLFQPSNTEYMVHVKTKPQMISKGVGLAASKRRQRR